MISSKKITSEIKIKPKLHDKHIIHLKKQFDENIDNETIKSFEELFIIDYFLYIVDQVIFSLQNRFDQFKEYENIFSFLFNDKKLK